MEFMKKIKGLNIYSIIIAILIFLMAIGVISSNFNDTDYVITITDKERIFDEDKSSSKYLVFGDDENNESLVFENTDCLIRGKWDSSNIQGELKEGNTYKVTVVGYRIPFLSWYQNIIKVEEITTE